MMTTDRELLEAAAKAAGLHIDSVNQAGRDACGGGDVGLWISREFPCWNPLTDDGDALRLAVKLRLQVTPGTYRDDEATVYLTATAEAHEYVHSQQDLLAATRRAIVRAAAAMAAR